MQSWARSHLAAYSFNTDDGIWRATIFNSYFVNQPIEVSIPMTVFGGLQFHYPAADGIDYVVSIPMTVFGGLQYCAPEPLGLLAPDE